MSNWNKVFKPIVVLCVICVVITGALAVTNDITAPIIAEATRVAQEKARTELLPEADGFTKADVTVENVSDVYVANNGTGAVVTAHGKGYGGNITVMVAFGPDQTVKQIKITEQSETAGLGVITCAIRFLGTMNEGVSFAILLMNLMVPYIDSLTRQDKLGIAKAKKGGAAK